MYTVARDFSATGAVILSAHSDQQCRHNRLSIPLMRPFLKLAKSEMEDTVVDVHVLEPGVNIFADDMVNVCAL